MDLLTSAKILATRLHVMENRQWYGNMVPHTHHCQDVENILVRFGFSDIEIRSAAWLHDAVEDTRDRDNSIKSRDIEELFGEEVGRLVEAVTDEPGENRKVRKALTYPKTRAAGPRAVALKLADRIANIEFGVANGSPQLKMYKKEYPDFRHALWTSLTEDARLVNMWNHLDGLMG